MATLPESASFWAKFKIGMYGWSHAALECIPWGIIGLLGGWLISPWIGAALEAVMLRYADKYWVKREIKQSRNMGRIPRYDDLKGVPKLLTDFWTADARLDVLFPRSVRKLWYVAMPAYSYWMFTQVGHLGILF